MWDGFIELDGNSAICLTNKAYLRTITSGRQGFDRWGKHKWRRNVADVVARLIAALEPEDVVLGGGNVKHLEKLPKGCRAGDNANAFLGGYFRFGRSKEHEYEKQLQNHSPIARSPSARHGGPRSHLQEVRKQHFAELFALTISAAKPYDAEGGGRLLRLLEESRDRSDDQAPLFNSRRNPGCGSGSTLCSAATKI